MKCLTRGLKERMGLLVVSLVYIVIGVALTAREKAKGFAFRRGAYNSSVGTLVATLGWPVVAVLVLSEIVKRDRFRVMGTDGRGMSWKNALAGARALAKETGRSQTIGDEESGDAWWVQPDGTYAKD